VPRYLLKGKKGKGMGMVTFMATAVAVAFCALFVREWLSMTRARADRLQRARTPGTARGPRRMNDASNGVGHADSSE
jgi:hypothetical protein